MDEHPRCPQCGSDVLNATVIRDHDAPSLWYGQLSVELRCGRHHQISDPKIRESFLRDAPDLFRRYVAQYVDQT